MTEQELREKIKQIVAPYISAWGDDDAIADSLIVNGIGDVSEWKHRAKRAEKTMIRLAEKYVDAAKINTIKDVNGKLYFAERRACVTYVAAMEMLEAEKDLQEERKDEK